MIHAWRRRAENHEAFLGIVYDGKEKVGKKRRRLRNKVAACGLQGAKHRTCSPPSRRARAIARLTRARASGPRHAPNAGTAFHHLARDASGLSFPRAKPNRGRPVGTGLAAAQKNHNVVDAKLTLYGSDGAACLETIGLEHFPGAPRPGPSGQGGPSRDRTSGSWTGIT